MHIVGPSRDSEIEMKAKDDMKELRALDATELKGKLSSTEEEMMNLRFRNAAGQLEQTAQLAQLRKRVARVKTVLKEVEALAQERQQ